MPANEDGIRCGMASCILHLLPLPAHIAEITDMNANAWGTVTAGVFADNGLALRAYLKRFYV